MDKEEAHLRVANLVGDKMRRMVAHALVELGRPLRCEMPLCILPDPEREHFEKTGRLRLSLNHIVKDSERPDNIRFAHIACNTSANVGTRYNKPKEVKTRGDSFSELPTVVQQIIVLSLGYEPAPESRWRMDHGEPVRIVDSC